MLHNYIFLVLIQFRTKNTPFCDLGHAAKLSTLCWQLCIFVGWKHIVCPLFLFPYVVTQRNKQNFCEKSENICIFLNTFNRPPRKDCACVSTIYKSCALMHLHLKRCKLNPFQKLIVDISDCYLLKARFNAHPTLSIFGFFKLLFINNSADLLY